MLTVTNAKIGRNLCHENMWPKPNQIEMSKNVFGIPSKKQEALRYLKEYCKCSTIHGVRYLSDEHRNCFERFFWATAIIISFVGCSLMINKIKTKMDTTPVIVTSAENPTKVYHVPFPAVTVCPASPLRQTAFNYSKYVQLIHEDDRFRSDFISWVNESKYSKDKHNLRPHETPQPSDYKTVFNESSRLRNNTLRYSLYQKLWAVYSLHGGLNIQNEFHDSKSTLPLDEKDMEFLLEVASKMDTNRTFVNNKVRWNNSEYVALTHHFRHLWTEFGLCFTFNMMDNIHIYRHEVINNDLYERKGLDNDFPKPHNDWDPDKGYFRVLRSRTYPYRAPHEEQHILENQLHIQLWELQEDIYEFFGKGTSSYEVIFHQPQDHPQPSLHPYTIMPVNRFQSVSVSLDVTTTSPELEKYDPHKRQCYYSHEKRLKYFKFYSQNNCHLECITNISLRMCNCVAFYMPRYNTTKICGGDAIQCLTEAKLQSASKEIDSAVKYLFDSGESPFNSRNRHAECDCLPSCLSVSYDVDSYGSLDLKSRELRFHTKSAPDDLEKFVMNQMTIRLKKTFFIASQRSEYYGQIDFMANCGGFLGLFCGISILSFIEIVFFLTIRLWTNIYRRITWRNQPGLPGGVPDVEDPARRIAFDGPPPRDLSLLNPHFCATCVCEKGPSRIHTRNVILATRARRQLFSEMECSSYRR